MGWGGVPQLRLEVRVDNSEEELSILIRPRRYGGSFSKRYLEGRWGVQGRRKEEAAMVTTAGR